MNRIGIKSGNKGSDIFLAKNKDEFAHLKQSLSKQSSETAFSPWRVKPGGLTISRSIGDADSKLKEKGGAGGVVVPDPDIYSMHLDQEVDFLLLGSDGVFDFVTPQEAVKLVWDAAADWKATHAPRSSYQDMLGTAVNRILERSLHKNADDNLTLILLIFQPFKLKTL